jgi:hypothetical protein
MSKRVCYHCDSALPPETEHYNISGEVYCMECVEPASYIAYTFYVYGEYVGSTEDEYDSRLVESYDDDYEEDEGGSDDE